LAVFDIKKIQHCIFGMDLYDGRIAAAMTSLIGGFMEIIGTTLYRPRLLMLQALFEGPSFCQPIT